MTLTREQILSLPAGAEIDRLVARRVNGWTLSTDTKDWKTNEVAAWMCPYKGDSNDLVWVGYWAVEPEKRRGEHGPEIPGYWLMAGNCVYEPSRRMDHAWPLVDLLRADKWLVTVKHMPEGCRYVIEGSRSEYDHPCPDRPIKTPPVLVELHCMDHGRVPWRMGIFAFADTVPLALCRVALLAKLNEG